MNDAERETMRVLEEAIEAYRGEGMEDKIWCEHMIDMNASWLGIDFKFCPLCAIPRPKDKTLAEKFEAWGEFNSDMSDKEMFKSLAEIAELHFKPKSL